MRLVWAVLLFLSGIVLAAKDFIALDLSPEWSYYSATAKSFEEADPTALTSAVESFNGIQREKVHFKKGVFRRQDRRPPIPSILVNEFVAKTDGTMLLHCGASVFRMKIALNGREILNVRTSNSCRRFGRPGTHDVPLEVKKGKNVLTIVYLGGEIAVTEGDPEIWRATLPTRSNFAGIRYAKPGTVEREIEETLIRNGVDGMTAPVFSKFGHAGDWPGSELEAMYDQYPVLEFYDRSMQKILKEIPETTVKKGIAVWHIYNMGYVVKTPESCFGIDVHHRLAAKLVPLLDFAMVSHKHGDHYDAAFCRAMDAAGKPVIANFLPEGGAVNPPAARWIKDVYLEFEATDHNAKLPNFIMCSRITCGRGKDAPVLYQTGDSCSPKQMHPSGRIDIHMLHPRVGLSVPEAAGLLRPREIWFSHMLEMGHCAPSIWRPVDYAEVYWDRDEIVKRGYDTKCRYPFWGEKFYIAPVR